MDLKQILKTLKLNETVISMGLGALVIIIAGILTFNFLIQRRGQITPSLQIGDEPLVLPTTHTVSENESLWDISVKYYKTGYNWTEIAQANNITDPNQIETGQTLTIPNVTPILLPTEVQVSTPKPSEAVKPTSTVTPTPIPQITKEAASTEAATQTPGTYKVEKGDNLWKIAEKYYNSGYNWVDIAKENSLKSPYVLEIGQELKIPDVATKGETVSQIPQEKQQAEAISGASYTVVKGDSLWKIAIRAYGDGYKWVEIAKENSLVNPNIIHSGNILRLPR